jgi:hypothetical protein
MQIWKNPSKVSINEPITENSLKRNVKNKFVGNLLLLLNKMFVLLEHNPSQHEFRLGLYSSLFLFEFYTERRNTELASGGDWLRRVVASSC